MSDGAWLGNLGKHGLTEMLDRLYGQAMYSDLIAVIPIDSPDEKKRCSWRLVFASECEEGVMTIDVHTHKGCLDAEPPRFYGADWCVPTRDACRMLRESMESLMRGNRNSVTSMVRAYEDVVFQKARSK